MSSKLLTQFRSMVNKTGPCSSGQQLMRGGSVSQILSSATENQKWWFLYYAFAGFSARPLNGWERASDAIKWASENYTIARKGTTLRKVMDIAKRVGAI